MTTELDALPVAVREAQLASWRRLSVARRFALAREIRERAVALAAASLRRADPGLSEADALRRAERRINGAE
jgi:hypothetical protein